MKNETRALLAAMPLTHEQAYDLIGKVIAAANRVSHGKCPNCDTYIFHNPGCRFA